MRQLRLTLVVLLLAAAALACNAVNLPSQAPAASPEPSDTAVPSATGQPPTLAVATPEATATVPIVHTLFPGEPPSAARYMTDRSSAVLATEHRSIADDFNNGLFERPFTSQVMDYKGYLDLTRGEIAATAGWLYLSLFLENPPSASEPAFYGAEFDLDLDGRGDWLVVGSAPATTTWSTDGVRAYQDANNDVGAQTPVRADAPSGVGDGYETLVFDQGAGPDPDAAWIRLSPNDPKVVQIALKPGLIGGDNEFLWGVWALADPQPGWYDYQDHFSLAQAGSPLSENSQYPIKDLALIDNTCRWGFDFNPVGNEPGVCPVPPTPTPTLTPSKTPTRTPTQIIIY